MEIPFKNIFAALKKGKKSSQKRAVITHPYRDWGILMLACLLVIILFILISAYLFLKIRSGELIVATPDTSISTKTINAKALREDLTFFRARETIYNQLLDEAPDVRDPAQ